MDELELRKEWMKEARVMTLEKLPEFLEKLRDFKHDYGTICRAIAAAGVAGACALEKSPSGGISGFQAGCVLWDLITGWDSSLDEQPLRLVQYENMLYPQYERYFEKTITIETWEHLQKRAKELLNNTEMASVNVIKHWKRIAEGEIPFGYRIGNSR